MFCSLIFDFSFNIKNNFFYFIHYNNPPNKPTPPPIRGPIPGICDPINAPPIAEVIGLALVFTCWFVTGNPAAIGDTIPEYCCKDWNGAKFCSLVNCSNCLPVVNMTELLMLFVIVYFFLVRIRRKLKVRLLGQLVLQFDFDSLANQVFYLHR